MMVFRHPHARHLDATHPAPNLAVLPAIHVCVRLNAPLSTVAKSATTATTCMAALAGKHSRQLTQQRFALKKRLSQLKPIARLRQVIMVGSMPCFGHQRTSQHRSGVLCILIITYITMMLKRVVVTRM